VTAGAIMLHQILNCKQFNGAGRRVFAQFIAEVVKPSGCPRRCGIFAGTKPPIRRGFG
jgi:hypothetical protein